MLLVMLKSYFEQVTDILSVIRQIKSIEIIRYDLDETELKEILIYRLRAVLKNNDLIEIMERVTALKKTGMFETTKYRVHWQNSGGQLIKRWDNAPHHFEITSHPHHVHDQSEENVKESDYKNVLGIIGAIQNCLMVDTDDI